MPQKTFTIRGKTYNLDDAADLVSIQNALVPENWPGKKADGVRHFLAMQEMLGFEIRRYFAAKYKKIVSQAVEEGQDGGEAKLGVTFAFTVDVTTPLAATLSNMKLSFSVRDVLTGKPKTVDLTQANFLDKLDSEDDMTKVLDTSSVTREVAEQEAAEAKEKSDAKDAKAAAKSKGKADAKAEAKVEKFPAGGKPNEAPPLPEDSATPPAVDKLPRRGK